MGRAFGVLGVLICSAVATAAEPATDPATQPAGDGVAPPVTLTSATQMAGTQPVQPEATPSVTETPRPYGFAGGSAGPEPVQGNDFFPIPDRFRIGLPGNYLEDRRGSRGSLLDPYNQNVLKGDYPILDDDKFLVLTVTSDTLFEARRLPVPSGTSSRASSRFDFFGQGDQQLGVENLLMSVDFFKGDTSFKPRDWDLRATVVYNANFVHADELQLIDRNIENDRDRFDEWLGVQELFGELHLADLSPNYDFASLRIGIQPFNADFRGFLFADNEPGIRFFGNYDNNKLQYNAVAFQQLEKNTNSGLNELNRRDQYVFIANAYRQDFLFDGYTAQVSFAANIDNGDYQYDDNGFLARPSPVGTIETDHVKAFYLGWAGDGKIGRFNLTHQFYQVFGSESNNPIAGQGTTINAQFFALELSYDQDWVRYRTSFMYASGDSHPNDGRATGFDSIFDDPNFAGGGTSFFARQAIRLTGSGVNLTNRNSFLPDLRTSKEEGEANFVNPGLLLYNIGADFDVTPKISISTNASYLMFDTPQTLRLILHDNSLKDDIGFDLSAGIRYRPQLNNNIIFNAGAAVLLPTNGFQELYSSSALYSTFVSMTLTF